MDPNTPHPVIDLMEEQKKVTAKGGTMRLGSYPCVITPGSLASKAYGSNLISERHRHRWEFNNKYLDQYVQAGMVTSEQVSQAQGKAQGKAHAKGKAQGKGKPKEDASAVVTGKGWDGVQADGMNKDGNMAVLGRLKKNLELTLRPNIAMSTVLRVRHRCLGVGETGTGKKRCSDLLTQSPRIRQNKASAQQKILL
jgi:hypothetical protein